MALPYQYRNEAFTIFLALLRIYSYNDRNGKHIYTTLRCKSEPIPCSSRGCFGICCLVHFHAARITWQGGRGWLRDLSSYWRALLSYWRPSTPFVCALYRRVLFGSYQSDLLCVFQ